MIKLSDYQTDLSQGKEKDKIQKKLEKIVKKIGDLQHKLYAENKRSLLVVLQGMDASGKDGASKSVFANCNPSGIDAFSFKKPSEEEFAHDFLWRVHKVAPKKGQIMVFIRSHYEDILVQKVHNWIDDEKRDMRMKAINAWEKLLQEDAQTTILKFYLHISPEVQEIKLQERIDDPEKQWKHNANDWEERKKWAEYQEAYEYVLNHSEIPWHIAPADVRWYRNYFIAKIVLETLEKMDPQLPHIQPSK